MKQTAPPPDQRYCECGCGTPIKKTKGIWNRWAPGHQYRRRNNPNQMIDTNGNQAQQAVCPVCRQTISINRNGTFRRHPRPWEPLGGTPCLGSRTPVESG